MQIEFDQINALVAESLKDLLLYDYILLENDVGERAITHRLAIYLEQRLRSLNLEGFSNLSVDCEYNRNSKSDEPYSPKRLVLESYELHKITDNYAQYSDERLAVSCYPDIIIHKRGCNKKNLLIIEVKKTTSRIKDDKFDIRKIKAFTVKDEQNEYDYQFGVFIKLDTRTPTNHPACEWYRDGEVIGGFHVVR